MGLYTLFAAKKTGPDGVIVAIEPSSRDFSRLKANIELNRLSNVRALQVAVSNYQGDAELLVASEEHSGHNTLGNFGYPGVTALRREPIRVERIDDIVQRLRLERVDIVKMDIEGAEYSALQGAVDTIARFHPTILLELFDKTLEHQNSTSGQIWDFLVQRGYSIYMFSHQTGLPSPAIRKPYFDSENIVATEERGDHGRIEKVREPALGT
jgi:FkbM family methyltransferase